MPNKLKFYLDKKTKNKVYTLKESIDKIPTKSAHYKFLKLPSITNSKN